MITAQNMTVLFILDYGTVGGATKAFEWMIRQLRPKGITIIVVTGKYNDFNESLKKDGFKSIPAGHYTAIEYINFKNWHWPYSLVKRVLRYHVCEYFAIKKLERELDFSKIDIIHTNSARNTLGCRLSKKYGIPHIVQIREFGDKDFDCIRLTPNYLSILNKYTTQFLSVSKAVMDSWNTKGINKEKNRVLYDGIAYDDVTISPDNEKKNKILRMVINGGVYPTKGQHLIIEAMCMLDKDIRDNLYLDVVGWYSSQYVSMMKGRASENGFVDHIRFMGSRDDVHERMRLYQIGFTCSKSEGFGLVTAEYMHGQLGVIASDSGANPELIEDNVTGLLFKSGDAKSLADCLTRLYNNRDLLIRLSHAAKEKARREYTQQKNAEAIYNVYQEILSKK